MAERLLLIKYGELGLKGKNKIQFINRLRNNIKAALAGLPVVDVRSSWGRIWVETEGDQTQIIDRLSKVFGIYAISPVKQANKDLDEIKEAVLQVLFDALPDGGTFKIETKRSDKTFPMTSPDISFEVAKRVFESLDKAWDADMHHPDRTIYIEIREEGAFIYGEVIPGAKGLPVGCGGKAMLMLSGGIDSPVAGWMAMKRGVTLEAIHFYSFPFTGEKSKEKVLDLCHIMTKWHGNPIKLHVVYFTEIQKAIYQNCPEEYGITIMRRMMFRLAEKIARHRSALAVYTGESVGQVASQTLESINTINDVVNIPVLRPLIGFDKEDIMKIARDIGTYETSIRPYEDCCTVFLPKFPKIRPKIKEAEEYEAALDIDALIKEALEKTEILVIE